MELSKEELYKIYNSRKIWFELMPKRDLRKLLNEHFFIMDYKGSDGNVYRFDGIITDAKFNLVVETFLEPERVELEIEYLGRDANYNVASILLDNILLFVHGKDPEALKLQVECTDTNYIINREALQ